MTYNIRNEIILDNKIYYLSSITSGATPGSQAPNFSSFSTTKIVNVDTSPSGISLNLPRYGNPKYLRWDIYYDGTIDQFLNLIKQSSWKSAARVHIGSNKSLIQVDIICNNGTIKKDTKLDRNYNTIN